MKQFFARILRFIGLTLIITVGVLLIIKIKDDTLVEKSIYEEKENVQAESKFLVERANNKLMNIKEEIEHEIGTETEIADLGSVSQIDIYFVVKVENDYRYVIKKIQDDGTEIFAISQDNNENGRYIVSLEAIGLNECIYTNVKNYNIDKNGVITYLNN